MKQFSSIELGNATGDVLAAAAQAPVLIARHGKPRFVMLSTDAYERLRSHGETLRACHAPDLTDVEADWPTAELHDGIDRPAGSLQLSVIRAVQARVDVSPCTRRR